MLNALRLLLSARNEKATIVTCFEKPSISVNAHANLVNDEDDLFNKLNADLDNIQQKEPPLVPEDMMSKIFMATKENVVTTASPITD